MRKEQWVQVVLLVVMVVLVACSRPPAQDEAKAAGIPVARFAQAPDEPDFFAPVDGGIGLDANEVRGRNTWWIWTGGNQAFWDWLATHSFGTDDLLKTLSSYPCSAEQRERASRFERAHGYPEERGGYRDAGYPPTGGYESDGYGSEAGEHALYREFACGDAMYPNPRLPPYRVYGRDTRFCYTGLINEPGFRKPTQPDEYGLCLDVPVDPVASFEGMGDEEERRRLEEVYGRPSGVLGLRLFPNPSFDAKAQARWKKAMEDDRFYLDRDFYTSSDLVRPYRVGMSCGFCHISHHPLHPPEDPENPKWENLSGTIGAQYFWFGRVFAANAESSNFFSRLLGAEPPGTADTSFIPADDLFNPRAMNAIFNLGGRVAIGGEIGTETSAGGALDLPEVQRHLAEDGASATFPVPHVLWDGADSVGVDAALTRVYINIGEYHQQWIRTIDPVVGFRKQSPITVAAAQENSTFWNATQERAEDLRDYLVTAGHPYPLKDAPGGEAYLTADAATLERGRVVFAETCARCHSSKLPEPVVALGEPGCIGPDYLSCWKRYWEWTESDEFKARMVELVEQPGFLEGNFLSSDARIPMHQPLLDFEPSGIPAGASTLERYLETARQRALATGALEGEICSAMATNAIAGHVWDNFSSRSYKSLPSVGTVELYNPIDDRVFGWTTPGGGRGYQRVPSLVSIWSTAPYLHNNEVGEFTGDPSVAGRMAAFDDAIRKLLWPALRPGTVPRTPWETRLEIPVAALGRGERALLPLRRLAGLGFVVRDGLLSLGPVPGAVGGRGGTPIGLIGNLNLSRTDADFGLWGLGGSLIGAIKALKRIDREEMDERQAADLLRTLVPELIDKSACPDFIVDRGHYFGTDLSDQDKEALIALLKTF